MRKNFANKCLLFSCRSKRVLFSYLVHCLLFFFYICKMSAFTEGALVKKLLDLNPSQQSIQTLSLWLIHHRKHHANIVKSWFKELQKSK